MEDHQQLKTLRKKVVNLEKENQNLHSKLEILEKKNRTMNKGQVLKYSMVMNKKATKIQKIFKGFLARKQFLKTIEQQKQNLQEKTIRQNSYFTTMKLIQTQVEQRGFSMEMLFRACSTKNQDYITIEEFKTFLKRLKFNFPQSIIQRLVYILDEDFQGKFSEKQYLDTIIAFNLHSEESTIKIEQNFQKELLTKFFNKISEQNIDLMIVFPQTFINHKEFTSFLDNSNEGIFSEKEKIFLIRIFDEQLKGVIDRNKILNLLQQQNNEGVFSLQKEQQDCFVPENIKNGAQQQKQSDQYLFNLFIQKFKKYNKTMKCFTDILGMQLLQNKEELIKENNSITLKFFKRFLEENFAIVLGQDLIDQFCENLFDKKIKFKSNYEKKKISQGDKYQNVFIDIIELKNKLIKISNFQQDTSKLLFVIKAIKLDQQELTTNKYIERYGYQQNKKVEFSEFFILAQKLLFANFQEVNFMQEKFDTEKSGYFSILPFIEEIDKYRNNTKQSNTNISLKELINKCKNINSNIINDFSQYLKNNFNSVNQNYSEQDVNKIFGMVFDNKIKKQEIEQFWQYIDINRNQKIETFEMIDFFVQYFGQTNDIFNITISLIGSQLDSQNITTREFFSNFDLYDENVLTKNIFIKKLEIILGIQEQHSLIIFNQLKNSQEKIQFKNFIESIEKNRKLKSNKIPQKKPSSIAMLSKASLEDQEQNSEKQQDVSKISLSDLGIIGNQLQMLLKDKNHELQAINNIILEHETESLPLLKLKNILLESFDKKETYLLINYFKSSDLNRNGFIDKDEWKVFSKNVGIEQKPEKIHIERIYPQNDVEFFNYVKKIQNQQAIQIDIDLLHQMSEMEGEEVSIINIKFLLKKNFPNQNIGLLMHLLSYFDNQKNGFIEFNKFKLLLILLDTCDEKEDWNIELFEKYSLSYDKLTKTSDNPNEIDLLKSLQYFVKFMCSDDELKMGRILNKYFEENQTLIINYQDFIQECNLQSTIEKFSSKYQNDDYRIITEIRKNLRKTEFSENQFQIIFKELNQKDQEYLNTNFQLQNLNDQEIIEFKQFCLFFNTNQSSRQYLGKSLFQNALQKKLQKTKSLLKEDNCNVLEIALKKLLIGISQKNMVKTKKIINQFFGKKDVQLNFAKFSQLCIEISKILNQDEILQIFHHLDDNNSHTISKDEFVQYIQENMEDFKKTKSHQEIQQQSYSELPNDLADKLHLSKLLEKSSQKLQEYQIKREDYFENNKTIFTNPIAVMKYTNDLVQQLTQKNQKFDDPEFGPIDGDECGTKSLYYDEVIPGQVSPDDIIWLRPEQISKNKKPVFLDGASSNDVLQGYLGDCWLIGAMSILAQSPDLIYQIPTKEELKNLNDETIFKIFSGIYPYVFHSLQQFGIYVFKFFKNSQWLYVVMDDKLPCFSGNLEEPSIVYAKCDSRHEFWVALTEKAYAKLHGNYWAIVGGQLDDALVDMTGRVSEKLKIMNGKKFNKELKSEEELKKKLIQEFKNNSMLGCSIQKTENTRGEGKVYKKGEFTGLISGHAYGLLEIIEISQECLLKIRNPWGSGNPIEWNGAWSDQTPELIKNLSEINQKVKEKRGQNAEEVFAENKDGAFLMSYKEFLTLWHNIQICKKFPEEYEGVRFISEWYDETAGGTPISPNPTSIQQYLNNPQFIIDLKEDAYIYLNLSQQDGRMKSKGQHMFPYDQISFILLLIVYRINQNDEKLKDYDQSKIVSPLIMRLNRDQQFGLELKKGKYAVVPSTKSPNQNGWFSLSFYYSCKNDKISITEADSGNKGFEIQEESEKQVKFDKEMYEAIIGFINN